MSESESLLKITPSTATRMQNT